MVIEIVWVKLQEEKEHQRASIFSIT